jgi:hypothetical protein
VDRLKSSADRTGKSLWGITCYFNPAGYRRRLANYRVFRERLIIPLVAVELAYGSNFELNENDADILIQLRGRDVMWQKERLLNVALQALPSSCRKVAWLDCDVVFEADDWADRTSLLLDRFPLVQPFTHAYRMSGDWQPEEQRPISELRRSVPALIASGMPVTTCIENPTKIGGLHGHAWAANRQLLDEHHFYDVCIIGGGDTAMLCAAYGCFGTDWLYMNHRRREHYRAWADPFYAAVGGKVACAEGGLLHLWHGKPEHRRLVERQKGLGPFQFDPFEDIALDRVGAWRWNTNKPEMHEYVRSYFASRREDV